MSGEAVERCKAVPLASRLGLSAAGFADGNINAGLLGPVSVDTLWSAFDTLLAENARLSLAVRAGETMATLISAAQRWCEFTAPCTHAKLPADDPCPKCALIEAVNTYDAASLERAR